MRNERTPRTLADTTFTTGYPEAVSRGDFWRGVALAILIGVALGAVLASA